MSNIYIQEPPTCGKILLKTTVGDIDIELWAKECPKACRNFVQLCMEGYYNNTIFHRVVKGFIVQGGDPNGDGSGGESIYGKPFKDEFHSRLRYSRRGLVGMANSDKDDNESQFFFTLAPTPELQNKNTLFGKVTGDTVFNMLKLEEGLVDHNEKPVYPHKIIKTEILHNPFDDIVMRCVEKVSKTNLEKFKIKDKGIKNFGLLSFGEEAEEDEQETSKFVQKTTRKGKSSHDILDDPKLSKEPVKIDILNYSSSDSEIYTHKENDNIKETTDRIRQKLKRNSQQIIGSYKDESKNVEIHQSDSEDDTLQTLEDERKIQREEKGKLIRDEIMTLKKQYKKDKKAKEDLLDKVIEKDLKCREANAVLNEYLNENEKYAHLKHQIPKEKQTREAFTLSLLNKFRNKLEKIKVQGSEASSNSEDIEVIEKDIQSDEWLSHQLKFEEKVPILAKDASTKSDDWYDVYDPRNPINKRKRGEGRERFAKKNRT